jgi:hypothetical protein
MRALDSRRADYGELLNLIIGPFCLLSNTSERFLSLNISPQPVHQLPLIFSVALTLEFISLLGDFLRQSKALIPHTTFSLLTSDVSAIVKELS